MLSDYSGVLPAKDAESTSVPPCDNCFGDNRESHVFPSHDDSAKTTDSPVRADPTNAPDKSAVDVEALEGFRDDSDLSGDEIEKLLLSDEDDVKNEGNRMKYAYFFSSRSRKPSSQPTDNANSFEGVDERDEKEKPEFMTMESRSLKCELDLSKITIRFQSPLSSFSSLSDAQLQERNALADESLLAREKALRSEEAFQKRWGETILQEGDVFSHDHLPSFYVAQNLQTLRRKERYVLSTLNARMRAQPCFASLLAKYRPVKSELLVDRQEMIRNLRRAIAEKRKANDVRELMAKSQLLTSAHRQRLSQGVTGQKLMERMVVATDGLICDGCFAAKKNPIMATVDYKDGVILRKFVGDREVREVNTESDRG